MKYRKLSGHILNAVRQEAKHNAPVRDLLLDLLLEEAMRPGQWMFKELYRKKIEEFSKKAGAGNEN